MNKLLNKIKSIFSYLTIPSWIKQEMNKDFQDRGQFINYARLFLFAENNIIILNYQDKEVNVYGYDSLSKLDLTQQLDDITLSSILYNIFISRDGCWSKRGNGGLYHNTFIENNLIRKESGSASAYFDRIKSSKLDEVIKAGKITLLGHENQNRKVYDKLELNYIAQKGLPLNIIQHRGDLENYIDYCDLKCAEHLTILYCLKPLLNVLNVHDYQHINEHEKIKELQHTDLNLFPSIINSLFDKIEDVQNEYYYNNDRSRNIILDKHADLAFKSITFFDTLKDSEDKLSTSINHKRIVGELDINNQRFDLYPNDIVLFLNKAPNANLTIHKDLNVLIQSYSGIKFKE